jgi:hypothetical protein
MGDHTTQMLELQSRRDDEKYAREQLLGGLYLNLHDDTISWIMNHTDCFISQCRVNKRVKNVYIYPYSVDGQDDEVWDKVGQAIGNLQSLERLIIIICRDDLDESDYSSDDNEVVAAVRIPDCEILERILRHVRQSVALVIDDERLWAVGEVQTLARAIRGHPTITSFEDSGMFPYASLDTLYSALATLPALESVWLRAPEVRQVNESTLAHPESLTELLRVPTLQIVRFECFSFTPALFEATANALIEGTAVTTLNFFACSFPAEESATRMANGLSRNTSVISIRVVQCSNARVLFDALAAAIPSNLAMEHLELGWRDNDDNDDSYCLPAVFLALGKNMGLKTLKVAVSESMDESLSTAIKDGLRMNATLESLELGPVKLTDDNSDLWASAFSFLRTNKALKSLVISPGYGAEESCLSAFCIDIAAMLQENAPLESLSILKRWHRIKIIKAEEYIAVVTVLHHNSMIKTLSLSHNDERERLCLTDDEDKQMATLLKKNYALESLPDIDLNNEAGDVGAILRLNGAGRRYLIEDGSSISKGVEVLSSVNNDINCVFMHLLENPRLCDRTAVAIECTDESNGGSTSPTASSVGGKREQASAPKGKKYRRRLA